MIVSKGGNNISPHEKQDYLTDRHFGDGIRLVLESEQGTHRAIVLPRAYCCRRLYLVAPRVVPTIKVLVPPLGPLRLYSMDTSFWKSLGKRTKETDCCEVTRK